MSAPASQDQAARAARALLARTLPGSRRGTVAAHLARASHIGAVIWRRWQVGPYRWQSKHLRWYLETQTAHHAPSTRYRHWLTCRVLVESLGQADAWLPRLLGPWVRPTGHGGALGFGRPRLRVVPRRIASSDEGRDP